MAPKKLRQTVQPLGPRDQVLALLDGDDRLVFFEPPEIFDRAIVGIVWGFNQAPAVVYDEAQVLRALARTMGHADAAEWFSVNTAGTDVGPATPRFLVRR